VNNCTHDDVTVTLDVTKEVQKIVCNECQYVLTLPEFRKRTFKSINIEEMK
jgi:hypothetical protein